MISTIQFQMKFLLKDNTPKMDHQYNPILDEYYAKNNVPKMNDQFRMNLFLKDNSKNG